MSGLLERSTPVLLRKSFLPVCSDGVGRVALWSCSIFSLIVQESGCQQKEGQGTASCCRYFSAPGIACDPPPTVFHQYTMPSSFLSLAASQSGGVCGSKWSGDTVSPPAFIVSMFPCQCPPWSRLVLSMEERKQPSSGLCWCCHRAIEQEPMKLA